MTEKPIDPRIDEALKKCNPQKAIYALAEVVDQYDTQIQGAQNTANAAAAQANSAYNRATDALNTANAVAEDVSRSLVDLNASGDGSTVTLNAPRNTGNPATAPLPVADATKAGVMNSATYVNLQNLNTRVSSLESQTTTYIVSFTNDNPTQDEINNAYKTAYPTAPFPPIDGTTVIDSTRQLYYRWVKNGAIWLKTTGFVISQFTNETAGTIKGSTTAGQIQAETDGTGSLVGYDQIKNDISANATGIQTLTANLGTTNTNVTNLDGRVTAVEGRVNNSLIALSSKSDATGVTITGTKQAGQPSETQIPVASATQSGIVTPTMFNAWNSGNSGNKPTTISIFRTTQTINITDELSIVPIKINATGLAVIFKGWASLNFITQNVITQNQDPPVTLRTNFGNDMDIEIFDTDGTPYMLTGFATLIMKSDSNYFIGNLYFGKNSVSETFTLSLSGLLF